MFTFIHAVLIILLFTEPFILEHTPMPKHSSIANLDQNLLKYIYALQVLQVSACSVIITFKIAEPFSSFTYQYQVELFLFSLV